MKIWLDDIRKPPIGWEWVKTVAETRRYLELYRPITEISLDHDLGENQQTGYDLIKWLEKKVMTEGYRPFPKIRVHSANPVGKKNIEAAVKRIEEYLKGKKDDI